QEVRFVGRARSHGGFSARMQHFVEVGPAHLDVASGVVTMGAHRVAHGVEGRVAFRLDPVDPMATHGLEVFRSASTKLTLDAQVDGVDAAEIFAPRARLEDGSGELHVAASVEHGVVLDGSEASYATRHVAVSIGPIGVRAEGDLALDAHVRAARGADGAARTEITAALPPSSIVRAGSRADAARIDAARFTAAFDDLELSGRGAFAGATVDVPRARVPDVALFAPEAGGPDVPVPERGAATARVHLEVDGELRGKGGVDVSVLGGAVRVKDVTVSGDSTASLDLTDFDLRRKRARFAGEADLVDAVIAREGRATRPMWLRAKLREGVIAVERGAPVDLRGALEVSDASELFPVFGAHGPAAWAPHLLGVHASAADVDLTHEGHALTLRFGARSGAVTAKGAVRFERGKRDGGVLVKDGPLAAGLSIATNGVDVHPQADAAWLRSRLAAIGRGSASR
ncbi:MAG TPA: hypothetical protein VHB21_08130, partial [Minicystis sp.]|nr:hypothetical protein [Minicystis sp.]